MAARLGANHYGKSGIRVATVHREGSTQHFAEATVDVTLEGDFEAAHVAGDNAAILATDTMRGRTYALARERGGLGELESFGLELADYCLGATPAATRATIGVDARRWQRLEVDGAPHPHAFTPAAGGRRTARTSRERDGSTEVRAGVADLALLKTTGSAFAGYVQDRYTTLPETDDRILATTVTAEWTYGDTDVDFDAYAGRVTKEICDAFARHDTSASVQHTIYAMGEAVLAAFPAVSDIHFSLPNQHHVLADLSPYGLDNPSEVFVVTDRPFGLIEATVSRS